GESGSGKSMTVKALVGLLRRFTTAERLELAGHDLLRLDPREWRELRAREVAMIFQEPRASLNPVVTVGRHLTEILRKHRHLGRSEAVAEAVRLLASVGIAD